VFILHSSLSADDQKAAFVKTDAIKIILATNIAESSITIPDVKYIIDFCLTKYLQNDSSRNMTSLELNWTSKNSCNQRAGKQIDIIPVKRGSVISFLSELFQDAQDEFVRAGFIDLWNVNSLKRKCRNPAHPK
jgi:hypothetical protein